MNEETEHTDICYFDHFLVKEVSIDDIIKTYPQLTDEQVRKLKEQDFRLHISI